MEMPGIEPGAFHMQSERSTAELHPRAWLPFLENHFRWDALSCSEA